ncbi:hypothetical protein ACLOJK_041497 [Asimina triloba]
MAAAVSEGVPATLNWAFIRRRTLKEAGQSLTSWELFPLIKVREQERGVEMHVGEYFPSGRAAGGRGSTVYGSSKQRHFMGLADWS